MTEIKPFVTQSTLHYSNEDSGDCTVNYNCAELYEGSTNELRTLYLPTSVLWFAS